jgi:hypothetical protein
MEEELVWELFVSISARTFRQVWIRERQDGRVSESSEMVDVSVDDVDVVLVIVLTIVLTVVLVAALVFISVPCSALL